MHKVKKITLAVTGGIGSGKTAFCGFLKSEGIPVINLDDISKELLENQIKYFWQKKFFQTAKMF
jgi:dephospho-CoA kinase